jgi:3-methyladenine DNA glycosylase AlkD
MSSQNIQNHLSGLANLVRAESSARFFKTGKGQYGEGDKFIGVKVPDQRLTARKYRDLAIGDLEELLKSEIHEYRLTALFILVLQFQKARGDARDLVVSFYLKNTQHINNWDLVDSSAPHILGEFLVGNPRDILYTLAKSEDLWERRIAILATQALIRNNQFDDTLAISKILLLDNHDLIHKAVGWMLREVGNRDLPVEISFLDKHYTQMPRTMLRYAIEKFPEDKRKHYLLK